MKVVGNDVTLDSLVVLLLLCILHIQRIISIQLKTYGNPTQAKLMKDPYITYQIHLWVHREAKRSRGHIKVTPRYDHHL